MPVEVKGGLALRKALKKFAPDLAKETQKEIASFLKPVVTQARGFIPSQAPLSGWGKASATGRFPEWSSSAAKRGIGYKTTPSKPNRRGFRSLARLFNKTAAGAIYETAGRKTPDSRFVQNLNSKYASSMKGQAKMEGRVLYRAYEEDQGKAQNGVLKAIEKAKIKLNQRATVVG